MQKNNIHQIEGPLTPNWHKGCPFCHLALPPETMDLREIYRQAGQGEVKVKKRADHVTLRSDTSEEDCSQTKSIQVRFDSLQKQKPL